MRSTTSRASSVPDTRASRARPWAVSAISSSSRKGYKDLINRGLGSGTFTTGPIELEAKATLTTTPGTALTPAGYMPGIVADALSAPVPRRSVPEPAGARQPGPLRPETTATNAAAAVAEAGVKPESSLVFGEVSEPIRKIATLLPISDEMLEDAPQISAYLNQRLTLFVKQQEEQQLLLGSGTAPNLQGLIGTTRTIGTYARGTADDNAPAIFKAANGARGSSSARRRHGRHPSHELAGDQDRQGRQGPIPGRRSLLRPLRRSAGSDVVVSVQRRRALGYAGGGHEAITVGTALVGAFGEGAAIFRKGGVTVEATNSHGTYFASDITTLRAELVSPSECSGRAHSSP